MDDKRKQRKIQRKSRKKKTFSSSRWGSFCAAYIMLSIPFLLSIGTHSCMGRSRSFFLSFFLWLEMRNLLISLGRRAGAVVLFIRMDSWTSGGRCMYSSCTFLRIFIILHERVFTSPCVCPPTACFFFFYGQSSTEFLFFFSSLILSRSPSLTRSSSSPSCPSGGEKRETKR